VLANQIKNGFNSLLQGFQE